MLPPDNHHHPLPARYSPSTVTFALTVLGMTSLLLNFFNVMFIRRKSTMHTPMYYVIANIALAEILFTVNAVVILGYFQQQTFRHPFRPKLKTTMKTTLDTKLSSQTPISSSSSKSGSTTVSTTRIISETSKSSLLPMSTLPSTVKSMERNSSSKTDVRNSRSSNTRIIPYNFKSSNTRRETKYSQRMLNHKPTYRRQLNRERKNKKKSMKNMHQKKKSRNKKPNKELRRKKYINKTEKFINATSLIRMLLFHISVFSTVVIAIDRYIAIRYCLRYQQILTSRKLLVIVSAVWIATGGFFVACYHGKGHFKSGHSTIFDKRKTVFWDVILWCLDLIACVTLISISMYTNVVRRNHITRMSERQSRFSRTPETETQLTVSRRLKQSVKDSFKLNYYTVFTLMLKISIEVIGFISRKPVHKGPRYRGKYEEISNLLMHVYIIINPFIFSLFMTDLRNEHKKLWLVLCPCQFTASTRSSENRHEHITVSTANTTFNFGNNDIISIRTNTEIENNKIQRQLSFSLRINKDNNTYSCRNQYTKHESQRNGSTYNIQTDVRIIDDSISHSHTNQEIIDNNNENHKNVSTHEDNDNIDNRTSNLQRTPPSIAATTHIENDQRTFGEEKLSIKDKYITTASSALEINSTEMTTAENRNTTTATTKL